MRRLTFFLTCAIFCGAACAAYSQSLADLAKKEKARREQMKSSERVITNQDSSRFKSGDVTTLAPVVETAPAPKPAPEKDKQVAAKPEKPASDEPVDSQGRPEAYWRQTLADARKKVKDLENEGNVLILKVADLRNQFYRESDGFKQQEINKLLNDALFNQKLNETRQAAAKDELNELLKEARKSGALPGWLDEKPAKP